MTTSLTRLSLLALPLVALALAGCGGGGGGSGGGVETSSAAYQGGFELCSAQTAQEIGDENGIDNATPEQAADVSAELVAGGGGEGQQADARAGCLAGFKATP